MAIANTGIPKNKFEALINAQAYKESMLQEYCILADSNIVYDIDFKDVLEFHKKNNADITVFTRKSKPQIKEIEMMVDEKNRAYDSLFKAFNRIYPGKFNNVTNGIAHRRWLGQANPELSEYLHKLLGVDFVKDLSKIVELLKYKYNKKVLSDLGKIKQGKKKQLAKYIKSFPTSS